MVEKAPRWVEPILSSFYPNDGTFGYHNLYAGGHIRIGKVQTICTYTQGGYIRKDLDEVL